MGTLEACKETPSGHTHLYIIESEANDSNVRKNIEIKHHTHEVIPDHKSGTSTFKQTSTMEADGINDHAPPVKKEKRSENTSPSKTDCRNIHISPVRFEVRLVNTTSNKLQEVILKMDNFPEMVRELKEALQEQFQIPMFDQVVIFGAEQLDDEKRLEYYRLKDGDLLTVKYTSTVDIKSFRLLLKDLKDAPSFLKDVRSKLSLGNVSSDFRQHLPQMLHVSDIVQRVEDLYNKPSCTCTDMVSLSTLLINSGELPLIDELHSMLVNLPLSTVCHVDLLQLERTLLRILWHVVRAMYGLPAVALHISINFDNVVRSFCRVRLTAGPISLPANPNVSSLAMNDHVIYIIFYSLSVLLK